jgi:hypothetical protein
MTVTDAKGEFSLRLPVELADWIMVAYGGLAEAKVRINPTNSQPLLVTLSKCG